MYMTNRHLQKNKPHQIRRRNIHRHPLRYDNLQFGLHNQKNLSMNHCNCHLYHPLTGYHQFPA